MTRVKWVMIPTALLGTVACGDKGGSPTAPSGPSAPVSPTPVTRIMAVDGNLDFGDVRIGTTASRTIRLFNQGTGVLTVNGIQWPASGSVFTASWTNGQIQPNQSQEIVVNFTPTLTQSYSGQAVFQANQTEGGTAITITARGVREPFRRSGVGNTVFDMPPGVTRLRITGDYAQRSTNFIIKVGGRLVVNELLGTSWGATHYEGTHLVTGTVVEITDSTGVSWSVTEVQQ